jgi:hypothetical protein
MNIGCFQFFQIVALCDIAVVLDQERKSGLGGAVALGIVISDAQRPHPEAVVGQLPVHLVNEHLDNVVLLVDASLLAVGDHLQRFLAPEGRPLDVLLLETELDRRKVAEFLALDAAALDRQGKRHGIAELIHVLDGGRIRILVPLFALYVSPGGVDGDRQCILDIEQFGWLGCVGFLRLCSDNTLNRNDEGEHSKMQTAHGGLSLEAISRIGHRSFPEMAG